MVAERSEFRVLGDPVGEMILGEDGELGAEGGGALDELGGFEVVGLKLHGLGGQVSEGLEKGVER